MGQFCFRWDYRFYDGLSRLLQANVDSGATVYNYGYDVASNLTNKNGVTRTYNAATQMVNDGTNSLSYDANGNLLATGYVWDRANRLVATPNASYAYDGLGNRVAQTVNSVLTEYLNDLQPALPKLLQEVTNGDTTRYIHSLRGIHSMERPTAVGSAVWGTSTWGNFTWGATSSGVLWEQFLQDGLGSVRAIADAAGVIQQSFDYDPYGEVILGSGDGWRFTGEYRDVNGLQYHRARYYDPMMGMWITKDFLETLNRYVYVSSNPTNRVDSSGLFDEQSCTIESGDYLEGIALQIGVQLDDRQFISDIPNPSLKQRRNAWQKIAMRNPHIVNPSLIFPGDRLYSLPTNKKNLTCRSPIVDQPPIGRIEDSIPCNNICPRDMYYNDSLSQCVPYCLSTTPIYDENGKVIGCEGPGINTIEDPRIPIDLTPSCGSLQQVGSDGYCEPIPDDECSVFFYLLEIEASRRGITPDEMLEKPYLMPIQLKAMQANCMADIVDDLYIIEPCLRDPAVARSVGLDLASILSTGGSNAVGIALSTIGLVNTALDPNSDLQSRGTAGIGMVSSLLELGWLGAFNSSVSMVRTLWTNCGVEERVR